MIEKIHVTSLKSIRDLTVECSKLNLFVGTNSSGKSSFIQSLLLFFQQSLNGKYVSLGEFREVRSHSAGNQPISILFQEKDKEKEAGIAFIENEDRDGYRMSFFGALENLEGFHYLSCHRIGANDIYSKNIKDDNDFGVDGEYALGYLLDHAEETVNENLIASDKNITNTLLDQTNYWLKEIVGTTMSIKDLNKTNYMQVTYNNNPANDASDAKYCRPINVGSGISYLISIIITCLAAEENAIVVIENPEIHLHPKAQSKLCEFLYFVSVSGKQLFVETHSDHIFNGLRAGVATEEMQGKNLSVNFFAMNNQYETQCNPIQFKEYGRIVGLNDEMDLDDLFDQFDIDLNRMLGI